MKDKLIEMAARVVARASRENPADGVLREVLRDQRGLSRPDARDISRAVFSYFRWRGWLDLASPIATQFEEARSLTERFRRSPLGVHDAELIRAVPDWISAELDASPAWLRSLQAEPRLWLRAKKGQGAQLAMKLGFGQELPPPYQDTVSYDGEEDLFRRPEFQAGEFEIQDLTSQAVGLLCDPQPGTTWWDACAGGGGKTLHLSDLMENKGLIWASDREEWRLKKLKQRAARAKCFNYRAALWDGGAKLPTKTKFDGVLVDAPCSGVGTWGRNPHARWTTTVEDVRDLAAVQRRLLTHVAVSVKPGGKLIFAVCTLTRAETSGVVEWFNANVAGFDPLDLDLKREGGPAPAPAISLWPQETGGNGMFVAAWRRRS